MATPEPLTPSRRLRGAAEAEQARLVRELGRIEHRMGSLREELERLGGVAEGLRAKLALLERLTGGPEPGSLSAPPAAAGALEPVAEVHTEELAAPLGYLRGAGIRHAAVRLLAASAEPTQPIHYARWFELVREAGYGVAGTDPLATFLTQISRSPVVRRAREPGMYALELDAVPRLRDRLRRLHDELLALHRGQQTIEEIASVRERRAELAREYGHVERALEEALEVLGDEASGPGESA
jgi:hypothetical protein